MRIVRLYDASREPRDWMDIIRPGQINGLFFVVRLLLLNMSYAAAERRRFDRIAGRHQDAA